jgi:hypothetical protein
MESPCNNNSNNIAAANNSDYQHRPSKRIRTPTKTYSAEPANDALSREEQRMLAQAISNSEKDLGINPEQLTSIPFGPTFYPTVEEFNGDPLLYLATIRAEAEKYGEFAVLVKCICSYSHDSHHKPKTGHCTINY